MTPEDSLTGKIATLLTAYLQEKGVPLPRVSFERPASSEHGDWSTNVAMANTGALGQAPMVTAAQATQYLQDKLGTDAPKIEIAKPGFINFFLPDSDYLGLVSGILTAGHDYGRNATLSKERWVVEHTSPNPNKAMHLGHLRNNLVGMSIVRLLEWNGATVSCDAVDNNRGIAIAKLMWGFIAFMRKDEATPATVEEWTAHPEVWETPADLGQVPDVFVANCYSLGEKDFKADVAVEAKVRDLVVQWETNDADVRQLWAFLLKYSYEGMGRTLTRLGNRWDKVWHESDHYQAGKDYVTQGLAKGVFVKLEDGAVLTNLEQFKLADTILLKRDGTALYITQDIALTDLKRKYYGADKLVWVIGPEQSLAMQQLFAVCEQLGIGHRTDYRHISYGYVGLKADDGGFKKMSSREGTVVLIDDILNDVKNRIVTEIMAEREWSDEEKEALPEKLAMAAVKFAFLKPDRSQEVTFDVEQSTQMRGDTGVYLLYTNVRLKSIMQKSGKAIETTPDMSRLAGGPAMELVRLLSKFPEVVEHSKSDLSVHHVAQYLLSVCSTFNAWYAKEIILDGSDVEPARLALVKACSIVIENGLSIMGIEPVGKM
jgi:arginyl-tRNA synthetase